MNPSACRWRACRMPGHPGLADRRPCLVAGLGPIRLLAAMVLRLRGAQVYGLDVVDAGTARRSGWNASAGKYIDGRQVSGRPGG